MRSGYGYSVQASANYEFIAAFIYDEVGVPRFLAAERGDAFAAASEEMVLYQLRGFAPLGAHTVPDRIEAGRLQRRYLPDGLESIGIRSAYTSTVPGEWTHAGPVTALSARQGCAP